MLHDVFFQMVNECVRLTVLALVMLPIRKILKRVSARMCYYFWSILPMSTLIRVFFFMFRDRDTIPGGLQTGSSLFVLPRELFYLLEAIWLLGMVVKLYGIVIPYIKLKRYLVGSIWKEENVFVSSRVTTPFSMGLFAPKIYLPAGLEEAYYVPVVLHEKVHIARKDLWVKAIAVFLTVLFWFCPIWNKLCDLCVEDMEAACDEAVVRKSPETFKQQYAEALIVVSSFGGDAQKLSLGCGREAIEERIDHILRYGKASKGNKRKTLFMCMVFGILLVSATPLLPNVFGRALAAETESGKTGDGEQSRDVNCRTIFLSKTE